jgi:hypothetical protein
MSQGRMTMEHDTIRKWAKERGAHPGSTSRFHKFVSRANA